MAIPYELYIRFLATKGLDDLKAVNEDLAAHHLFPIQQDLLDRQWDLIHSVVSKGILAQIERKTYCADFLQYMRVLEVEDLWLAEPGVTAGSKNTNPKLVYDILQDPMLKITANGLFIKKMHVAELTRILTAKFSALYKDIHFDIYSRFFFNPCRMTRRDWKEYLRLCGERERRIYFTALTEDMEVLKTELDLPAQVSVSNTLQYLLTKSFQKAKTYLNINTPEAGKEAREWISQVSNLADKYEKHRSGDQHDFAKSLQMEFDFIDDQFDTPDSDTILSVPKSPTA